MKRRGTFARGALLAAFCAGASYATSLDTPLPQKSAKLIIKITQGKQLWYFGGLPKPSSFTFGDVEIALTALGRTQGTFQWDVIAGADKVELEGGVSSLTKTNDNTVMVKSKKASGSTPKDVSIRLTYNGSKATKKFEVRAPKQMDSEVIGDHAAGLTCTSDGSLGWRSGIAYTLRDQYGAIVPNVPVNETLGPKTNIESNNWPMTTSGMTTATDENGQFGDLLCVTGLVNPQPQVPGSPTLSARLIDKVGQGWFVGDTTSGVGVRVQSNNASRFIDHGRATEITSP